MCECRDSWALSSNVLVFVPEDYGKVGKVWCSKRMQPHAERSRGWDKERIWQGSISAISGLTTILAQDSMDPNAESPALSMLAWVHFCCFPADCQVQNCFSGSLSLIYRWKWIMRYNLGPLSPIFAEPLARLRGDRDEQHRVLLYATSVQFLHVFRELHCGKIPHLTEQEPWQPWMSGFKSSKFQFF